MYRAINEGYVEVARGRSRQRIIRSMRLTPKGMDYISDRDSKALAYILAKQDEQPTAHSSTEKVLRQHSLKGEAASPPEGCAPELHPLPPLRCPRHPR